MKNKGFTILEMLVAIILMAAMLIGFISLKISSLTKEYDNSPQYRIINSELNNKTVFVNKYSKDINGNIILGNICNGNLLFSNGDIKNPSMPIFDKYNKQVKCEFIKQ